MDSKGYEDLEWPAFARCFARLANELIEIGRDVGNHPRDRIAAYKEARQQLMAIPEIDDKRRERVELDELRQLERSIREGVAEIHGAKRGHLGAAEAPAIDQPAH